MPSSNPSLTPSAAASRSLSDVAALAGFRPSATQRRFVQLAVASEAPLRIAVLCEQLGIARSTYYRWLDQPGFRAWMSLQWASALVADGGRLLSIARARAETDFRYWKALAELIFDPRGLGLLAAWQQRMAQSDVATPTGIAPLVAPDNIIDDALLDPDLENTEPKAGQHVPVPTAATVPSANPSVASPNPAESTTSVPPTQQFPAPRRPLEPEVPPPYIRGAPPPWPGAGRFRY